jgi:anti-anti-sigma factor
VFHVQPVHGDGQTFELVGELDMAAAPHFLVAVKSVDVGVDVALDAARLTFVDSSGIYLLVQLAERMQAARSRVVIRRPTPGLLRMLELTSVASMFTIEPDGTADD